MDFMHVSCDRRSDRWNYREGCSSPREETMKVEGSLSITTGVIGLRLEHLDANLHLINDEGNVKSSDAKRTEEASRPPAPAIVH
jgi:hypothetical protein